MVQLLICQALDARDVDAQRDPPVISPLIDWRAVLTNELNQTKLASRYVHGHLVDHFELRPVQACAAVACGATDDPHDADPRAGNDDGRRTRPVHGWILQTIARGGTFNGLEDMPPMFRTGMASDGMWARTLSYDPTDGEVVFGDLNPPPGDVPSLDATVSGGGVPIDVEKATECLRPATPPFLDPPILPTEAFCPPPNPDDADSQPGVLMTVFDVATVGVFVPNVQWHYTVSTSGTVPIPSFMLLCKTNSDKLRQGF